MKKRLLVSAVGVAVLAAAVYLLGPKPSPVEAPRHPLAVRIATANQPIGCLLYVACQNGYMDREGLSVTLLPFSSGKDALNATLEGKADFAEVAETPVVLSALRGEKLAVVATIASTQKGMAVAGRKDRGVTAPKDIKGKKVGVTPGTNGDFFFRIFMLRHGLQREDVQIVDVPPDRMVQALTDGEVDAVATWQPHLARLGRAMGDGASVFYGEGLYTWAWNIVGRRDYVSGNPDACTRLVRALLRADEFVNREPDRARGIVAAHLKMDPGLLADIWRTLDFGVALGQWLLISMEEQAKWAIEEGRAATNATPNFLEVFDSRALNAACPEAVDIIQ